MRTKPIVLATLAVILFGLFSGPASRPANAAVIQFNEFQITTNSASQINPDISDTNIVYQDNRDGNWHIYMYRLQGAWEPETRIGSSLANQINPKIAGDKIVYQDDRDGNWNIYMYDLTTQTESRVAGDDAPSAQEFPAIDGNRIVWQDNRNGNRDIYMYDLSTQTESRVTTSGSNISPAISGNRIAYIKDGDVYYFDLSNGNEARLTANDGHWTKRNAGDPAISADRVVWHVEHLNWNDRYTWAVYMRDVMTGAAWDTTALYVTNQRTHSHISELYTGVYYIVYQEYWPLYGQQSDIYLYRTDAQALHQLTANFANQEKPRVSGGRIVYQDDRNGNWDIYMTMVSYLPGDPPPPTPDAAVQKIQGIKSLIADPAQIPTSDLEGANSNVKDNRRNALLNKLDAVIANIQAGGYQGAIEQLHSILDKTDGCALRGGPDGTGTGFTPDWVITCASQALIELPIRESITALQTLQQR